MRGTGGKGGGTKARTISPATGVSMKLPSRGLGFESDMGCDDALSLFKRLTFSLNNELAKASPLK